MSLQAKAFAKFEKKLNELVKTQLMVFRTHYKFVKGMLEVYTSDNKLVDCISLSVENSNRNDRTVQDQTDFIFEVLKKLISTNVRANYSLGEHGRIEGVLHIMSEEKKPIKLTCRFEEEFEGTLLSKAGIKRESEEFIIISDDENSDTENVVVRESILEGEIGTCTRSRTKKLRRTALSTSTNIDLLSNIQTTLDFSSNSDTLLNNNNEEEEMDAEPEPETESNENEPTFNSQTEEMPLAVREHSEKTAYKTLISGLTCLDCDKVYCSADEFSEHLISHHLPHIENQRPEGFMQQSENSYICTLCKKNFSQRSKLMKHLVGVHLVSRRNCAHCPVCGKEGSTYVISTHLNQFHLFRKKCNVCRQYVKRGDEYIKHFTDEHPDVIKECREDFIAKEMKSAISFFRKNKLSSKVVDTLDSSSS